MAFAYPYAENRAALNRLHRAQPADPRHGTKMFYDISRGYPMPTMSAFLQLLPAGFRGEPWRATDASCLLCRQAKLLPTSAERPGLAGARRVQSVPSWHHPSHEADRDAVLVRLLQPHTAQQALGLWRSLTPYAEKCPYQPGFQST